MSNCDYQPQGSEGPTTDTTHALMRSSASWTACQGQTCVYRISASARILSTSTRPESGSIYGDTVTWRNSRPWALSTLRSPGRAITNRAARRAQPAKAPRVGEQLPPRSLLWLVRTHCGLGRICGSRRILNRRDHGRDDLRKPRAGLLGFEAVTCGSYIPDSPSTRREFSDNSRRHEANRKPLSSANVPTKTPGGPRRARTDDLRIKDAMCQKCAIWPFSGTLRWGTKANPKLLTSTN